MTTINSNPATAAEEFVLTHVCNAPRDRVFQAWTDPDQLKHWWGPKGFTMSSCDIDLRPGGTFHYGMNSPQGQVMWGIWVFREVVPPERLVFVSSFSDENRGITRHSSASAWPLETLSTVELTEHDGKTTLNMRGIPINATDQERDAFKAGHESMRMGWAGPLDQLDRFLAGDR